VLLDVIACPFNGGKNEHGLVNIDGPGCFAKPFFQSWETPVRDAGNDSVLMDGLADGVFRHRGIFIGSPCARNTFRPSNFFAFLFWPTSAQSLPAVLFSVSESRPE